VSSAERERMLTIRDRGSSLEATFVPGAGMLCSSLRHEGEELLAQRGGIEAYVEHGSTFGIPLLHPWANRLRGWEYDACGKHVELDRKDPLVHQDSALAIPMHGLLSASPYWQLTDADLDLVAAELDFGAVPEYMRSFPFPHRLTYTATVKESTLEIELTVTATGDLPVPISFGFHPYLTLPASAREDWQIALPVTDRSGASSGSATDAGPLGERAFDDGFTLLTGDPPVFELTDTRRKLAVEFVHGYAVAQVFTQATSDFICYEPMTAPVDALRSGEGLRCVAPGEQFTAVFMIAVGSV
jgi:aldose 1-epimerase